MKSHLEKIDEFLTAALKGDKETVELLINEGIDINCKNKNEFTALHYAAQRGNKEIIELLLDKGADIESKMDDNTTPLHIAIINGRIQSAEVLLNRNADITAKNRFYTPLRLAVTKKNYDIVELLLKKSILLNVDILSEDEEILFDAIETNNNAVIKILIEYGANIQARNYLGISPLHQAAMIGNKEIFEILLLKGADIEKLDKHNNNILHNISKYRLKEIFKDENKDSREILKLNYKDIIKILLETNLNIQSKNRKGNSPIHLAASMGDDEIIKLLLEKGANIHSKNHKGNTPLHKATSHGRNEVIELLLNNGANINDKNYKGNTPLHITACKGDEEIIKLLLEKGAYINSKNYEGNVPIHLAVYEGQEEIVTLLIQNGADINTRNKKDKDIYDFTLEFLEKEGWYENSTHNDPLRIKKLDKIISVFIPTYDIHDIDNSILDEFQHVENVKIEELINIERLTAICRLKGLPRNLDIFMDKSPLSESIKNILVNQLNIIKSSTEEIINAIEEPLTLLLRNSHLGKFILPYSEIDNLKSVYKDEDILKTKKFYEDYPHFTPIKFFELITSDNNHDCLTLLFEDLNVSKDLFLRVNKLIIYSELKSNLIKLEKKFNNFKTRTEYFVYQYQNLRNENYELTKKLEELTKKTNDVDCLITNNNNNNNNNNVLDSVRPTLATDEFESFTQENKKTRYI